ncbi:MAG: zf-HC2 domain-containing protein, partial [Clostridiales bacterium]|nr:zf-HC2 domain-containing protein [Clostridiales bacterium]
MRCHKVLELTEEYIMGELNADRRAFIENHFRECADCRKEYEEIKVLVNNIRNIKNRLNPEEVNITMNKRNIVKQLGRPERHPFMRFVPGFAACVFLVMFLLA